MIVLKMRSNSNQPTYRIWSWHEHPLSISKTCGLLLFLTGLDSFLVDS